MAEMSDLNKPVERSVDGYPYDFTGRRVPGKPPCSLAGMQHYSFDHAQYIMYSRCIIHIICTNKWGPPRKCQCFNVCDKGSDPGVIYVRKYATELETSINVLRNKDHRFAEL